MDTVVMDEVLRQRDEGLKAAVLHMIAEKPKLAIEQFSPGVLEMAPDELGERAAALWLDLDPALREGTKILAPTHARRREINTAVREGLQAEGSLHGRTLEIERYVNLHLTRAQKGEIGNWQPGEMAVFHHDVCGVQAKAGDACRILETEDGKVVLGHPDGRPRKGDPSNYLRYRVDLFETEAMELQAGDRIRWTRNDKERSLLNGEGRGSSQSATGTCASSRVTAVSSSWAVTTRSSTLSTMPGPARFMRHRGPPATE